jgi:ketosteroid isomerase-like protein
MNRASRIEPTSSTTLGRRDYDLALSNRLEQLRTAMGEEASSPADIRARAMVAPEHPKAHSAKQLFLASGLSAILGAGLTWLFMSTQHEERLPPAMPPAAVSETLPRSATTAPAPAMIAPPPASQPNISNAQEAQELVERWRLAWANRDVDSYLDFYVPDFAPEGQSHSKWAASRRTKLAGSAAITLQIREVKVNVIDNSHLKVSFLQDYASGNYQENGRAKALLLKRGTTGWKIISEQQVSQR